MIRRSESIRWRIVAMLAMMSVVSYMMRTNISVAAKFMMPELGLTKIQMGQIFSAFMLGYALFQVPAGILGDKIGPRFVLTAASISWAAATLVTAIAPGYLLKSTVGVFICLLSVRFLLGVAEAPTYPVAALAIANWVPMSERAFANSLVIGGLSLGSAVTPPLVSWIMLRAGWRASYYVLTLIALLMAIVWWIRATNSPEEDPGVTTKELRVISTARTKFLQATNRRFGWHILFTRDIGLLSLSYFFAGYVLFMYVFWFYLYLVEVRGFSILGGGLFAGLPFFVSTFLTPLGGLACDTLSNRVGRSAGRRTVAITGFIMASAFLYLGLQVQNPYVAIGCLSLSVGFLESTEGVFWSTATALSGPHSGAAGGLMNTAGNLGGVVSTSLVPILIANYGWGVALRSGSILALVGGVIWFAIRE